LLADAFGARLREDEPALRRCVAELAARPDIAGWRQMAELAIVAMLQRGVAFAWNYGWQPADVARVVSREAGSRHAHVAVDAMAAEMRGYAAATVDERWQAQLSSLDARVWWDERRGYLQARGDREGIDRAAVIACVLDVLFVLTGLPRLPLLCPLPGTARRTGRGPERQAQAVDERVLGRIRALLAKAESTEFPEEAEALTERAQELTARHSIDQALLAARSGTPSEPEGRRMAVDSPYEAPKAVLLDVVAAANRCRAVWHQGFGFSTVFGFAADLTAVELLFTSLLVQATTAMVGAGARRDVYGRSRTRSFRQSFLTAYAQRIGERLHAAADNVATQVAAESAGRNLLPVLAARDRVVDDAVREMCGELEEHALRARDHEGWVSGRAAADLASLNPRTEITPRQEAGT